MILILQTYLLGENIQKKTPNTPQQHQPLKQFILVFHNYVWIFSARSDIYFQIGRVKTIAPNPNISFTVEGNIYSSFKQTPPPASLNCQKSPQKHDIYFCPIG